MGQLLDAIEADFEGYDDIRKLCLDAPKWGINDDYVDQLLADAVPELTSYVRSKRNTRGGYLDLPFRIIKCRCRPEHSAGRCPAAENVHALCRYTVR